MPAAILTDSVDPLPDKDTFPGSMRGISVSRARGAVPETAPEDGEEPHLDKDSQRGIEGFTRIVLRPLASPLPLGFFAFGIGSVLQSAFQLGLILLILGTVGVLGKPLLASAMFLAFFALA